MSASSGRETGARRLTIALAGNPNSGKTTIFNAITGTRQKVGNWPGVTVEKKEGQIERFGYDLRIVDLPGTYSLTPFSIEEIVARDFVLDGHPDVVIDIIDASNQFISANTDRMKTDHPIRIDRQRARSPGGGDFGRKDGLTGGRVQVIEAPFWEAGLVLHLVLG